MPAAAAGCLPPIPSGLPLLTRTGRKAFFCAETLLRLWPGREVPASSQFVPTVDSPLPHGIRNYNYRIPLLLHQVFLVLLLISFALLHHIGPTQADSRCKMTNVRINAFLLRLVLLLHKQERTVRSLAYHPIQPSIPSMTEKVLQELLHPCLAQQQWQGLCRPCRLVDRLARGDGKRARTRLRVDPRFNMATLLGMSWPPRLSHHHYLHAVVLSSLKGSTE